MKALFLSSLISSFLIMTGCASTKPLTEKDGFYKEYTHISNYERIVVDSNDIQVRVMLSDSVSKEIADKSLIQNSMKANMLEKGLNVEFTDSAKYVVFVNAIEKSDRTSLNNFNPLPSNLANMTHQATGSASSGAAALGVGLVANAFTDKRMWLIDLSILKNGEEHTRYVRLAPSAAEKRALNGISGLAASEYFVQAK